MSLPSRSIRLPAEYDPRAIEAALREILTAMESGFRYVIYQEWNAEPERPQPYMTVLADGTNWNPGSGQGLYRRNEANTAWVFIG